MASPRIKGAAIRALLDWYRKTFGLEAHERLFDQLTDDERALLGDRTREVLPNAWYEARIAHRLLEVALGPIPVDQRRAVVRDASRDALKQLRGGVYKFVVQQIVTPAFYARHIQRLFRLLHDNGERRIDIVAPGEAISVVSEWRGHHPLACLMVDETMAAVFETIGCEDVTTEQEACVSLGDAECRCRVRWRV